MGRKWKAAAHVVIDVFRRRDGYREFAVKTASQKGFSLIEVLIGVALTALLLQGMFPLLATSLHSCRSSVAKSLTHQSARMAIEAMTRELRFASVIAWPPPGQPDSRVRFRKLESDGSQSTLGFQLGLSSGQNPKAIYRTNTLGQASPLTENVASTLRFEYIEPRLVKIELIVTDDATGQQDFISTSVTCVNVVE